jgi:hypothetical protein
VEIYVALTESKGRLFYLKSDVESTEKMADINIMNFPYFALFFA